MKKVLMRLKFFENSIFDKSVFSNQTLKSKVFFIDLLLVFSFMMIVSLIESIMILVFGGYVISSFYIARLLVMADDFYTYRPMRTSVAVALAMFVISPFVLLLFVFNGSFEKDRYVIFYYIFSLFFSGILGKMLMDNYPKEPGSILKYCCTRSHNISYYNVVRLVIEKKRKITCSICNKTIYLRLPSIFYYYLVVACFNIWPMISFLKIESLYLAVTLLLTPPLIVSIYLKHYLDLDVKPHIRE